MRARLTLPDAPGTTFLWRPDGGVVAIPRGAEVVSETVGPAKKMRPPDAGIEPGPEYDMHERERAMIGGWICGEVDGFQLDGLVRQIDHRRIVDALLPSGARSVCEAIDVCKRAGLPPELTGRHDGEDATGYLAGCVRTWRDVCRDLAPGESEER